MNDNIIIVERSSGYWIVDDMGILAGPFFDLEECKEILNDIIKEND